MKINTIQMPGEIAKIDFDKKAQDTSEGGFAAVMSDAINGINTTQLDADKRVEEMLTGKDRNIHEAMISLEKADISIKLLVAVKNKALEAYNTIMRLQG